MCNLGSLVADEAGRFLSTAGEGNSRLLDSGAVLLGSFEITRSYTGSNVEVELTGSIFARNLRHVMVV